MKRSLILNSTPTYTPISNTKGAQFSALSVCSCLDAEKNSLKENVRNMVPLRVENPIDPKGLWLMMRRCRIKSEGTLNELLRAAVVMLLIENNESVKIKIERRASVVLFITANKSSLSLLLARRVGTSLQQKISIREKDTGADPPP